MRRNSQRRRGAVVVLVAVLLIVIISVVAIAWDAGLLLDNRRSVQAAADAAALAAADELFENYGTNNGVDPAPSYPAQASALATAAANGYSNDGVTSVVTVNIPPTSGNFVGKAGYAEVIVQFNQKRGFSRIFGSGDLPVQARAVARGIPGNVGLLILDPTISDSCEIDGNVSIQNGGQIWVNSTDAAATQVASTSKLTTGGLDLVGGLQNNGSITYTNGGGLQTGVSPMPDPLASIPEPTTAGLTNYGSVTVTTDTTLSPGIYTNIIIQAPAAPRAPSRQGLP